jgi:hypothetical protein
MDSFPSKEIAVETVDGYTINLLKCLGKGTKGKIYHAIKAG